MFGKQWIILDSSSSSFDYDDQPSLDEKLIRQRKIVQDEFVEDIQ